MYQSAVSCCIFAVSVCCISGFTRVCRWAQRQRTRTWGCVCGAHELSTAQKAFLAVSQHTHNTPVCAIEPYSMVLHRLGFSGDTSLWLYHAVFLLYFCCITAVSLRTHSSDVSRCIKGLMYQYCIADVS